MEGKAPFKTLLGHALVKDETGRDMHKSWGNAIWFEDAAEKMGVDVMRWLYASQNPERNLLFGYSIADEVRKKIITLWNTYSFFVTYANLDNYNPDKKVDKSALTKLDKWLLSKINQLSIRANDLYGEFKVYNLMDEIDEFLDDLSNWYIRRNRRRFWKSENDNDKNAAYYTLHTTLVKYLKIISPIAPFISDYMYQNLNTSSSIGKSIHLEDYPLSEASSINKDLIQEIDTLIEVISLGRAARNKANIKIRQPLSEVIIYSQDTSCTKYLLNNKNDILEELNVKAARFVGKQEEVVSVNIKPDFQVLGQKFNKNMKEVLSKIKQLDKTILKDIVDNRKTKYEISKDLKIDYSDFIVEEIPNEGFEVSSNNSFTIGININIDDTLKKEGMIRDLIRHVQNFRKESGLDISDRISISLSSNKDLESAIKNHKKYFMNEVLGVNIRLDGYGLDFNKNIQIGDQKIKLGLSKES
jgi:isoleucyl-tRNA synthetase